MNLSVDEGIVEIFPNGLVEFQDCTPISKEALKKIVDEADDFVRWAKNRKTYKIVEPDIREK